MTDILTECLRTQAANDRHLAKVERLLGREGVSPAVLGHVATLVDAPVGRRRRGHRCGRPGPAQGRAWSVGHDRPVGGHGREDAARSRR